MRDRWLCGYERAAGDSAVGIEFLEAVASIAILIMVASDLSDREKTAGMPPGVLEGIRRGAPLRYRHYLERTGVLLTKVEALLE